MKVTDDLRSKVVPAGDCIWEVPTSAKPGMLVPARIYASESLLEQMDQGVFEQVTNVACLPGIVRAALCMPDGHWGYGFPIGGVAAFNPDVGRHFPGRHRLRHQLRDAAAPHEPHGGRRAAPALRSGQRALQRGALRCRRQGVRPSLASRSSIG